MSRTRLWVAMVGLGFGLAGAGYVHGQAAAPKRPSPPVVSLGAAPARTQVPSVVPATVSVQRAFLDRYCVTCHNQRARTASLSLESSDMDVSNVGAQAEVWEKVVHKLRARAMPPL